MPFVPLVHFPPLLAQYKGTGTLVASGVDGSRMPPALFGAEWFEMLQQLNGDQGARSLISSATLVVDRPEDLVDIDSPADLERRMKHFDWSSEELRVGKECVSTCRSRCRRYHKNKQSRKVNANKTTNI